MSNPWILYAVCAVMLIIALAALLPTIFRAKEAETEDVRNARAESFVSEALRAEKAQLDSDHADGRLDQAHYDAMLADLRRRILEEQKPALNDEEKKLERVPLKVTRGELAAIVVALVTFVSVGSYWFLGAPEMLELAQAQKVLQGTASAESIEAYLEKAPKDGRAWVLLAHRKIDEGDFRTASRAYKAARDSSEKIARDPDVMLEYGAAVLTAKETELYADAYKALNEALVLKAGDPRAEQLALMGAVAMEDWSGAASLVRNMIQKMPPDSPDYMQAEQTLRMLESRAQSKAETKAKP
ncbi:c-type cytochrome biogenesis protein CcmI [Sutterella seckii]|uniref:C-type cytochrome biogenesis protein CcmI n=1 Tax=Sutterella seckii TaxID=1944635 RepID=A0A6I1ETN7_9BURK|nr:c-type cytochrome biogenesis protein CcmI [Sutterella seckii]KAB7660985.1 c-type cytochrome biogenesis protein CcmI [Sutterella seckii]